MTTRATFSFLLFFAVSRRGFTQTHECRELMVPMRDGVELATDVYPISNVFKAGHRIRLIVASSSFPKWYPNGNTGREINEDFPPVVATNRIFHDREHPSRIRLPVIPRDTSTQ